MVLVFLLDVNESAEKKLCLSVNFKLMTLKSNTGSSEHSRGWLQTKLLSADHVSFLDSLTFFSKEILKISEIFAVVSKAKFVKNRRRRKFYYLKKNLNARL